MNISLKYNLLFAFICIASIAPAISAEVKPISEDWVIGHVRQVTKIGHNFFADANIGLLASESKLVKVSFNDHCNTDPIQYDYETYYCLAEDSLQELKVSSNIKIILEKKYPTDKAYTQLFVQQEKIILVLLQDQLNITAQISLFDIKTKRFTHNEVFNLKLIEPNFLCNFKSVGGGEIGLFFDFLCVKPVVITNYRYYAYTKWGTNSSIIVGEPQPYEEAFQNQIYFIEKLNFLVGEDVRAGFDELNQGVANLTRYGSIGVQIEENLFSTINVTDKGLSFQTFVHSDGEIFANPTENFIPIPMPSINTVHQYYMTQSKELVTVFDLYNVAIVYDREKEAIKEWTTATRNSKLTPNGTIVNFFDLGFSVQTPSGDRSVQILAKGSGEVSFSFDLLDSNVFYVSHLGVNSTNENSLVYDMRTMTQVDEIYAGIDNKFITRLSDSKYEFINAKINYEQTDSANVEIIKVTGKNTTTDHSTTLIKYTVEDVNNIKNEYFVTFVHYNEKKDEICIVSYVEGRTNITFWDIKTKKIIDSVQYVLDFENRIHNDYLGIKRSGVNSYEIFSFLERKIVQTFEPSTYQIETSDYPVFADVDVTKYPNIAGGVIFWSLTDRKVYSLDYNNDIIDLEYETSDNINVLGSIWPEIFMRDSSTIFINNPLAPFNHWKEYKFTRGSCKAQKEDEKLFLQNVLN